MKRGFTLIELLAVIVILAIIALIAIPVLVNIIGNSKENSQKRSIDGYARAIKESSADYQIKNNKNLIGRFRTTDGKTLTRTETKNNEEVTITFNVDYKGNVVCENIILNKNGTIYLSECTVDGIKVDYEHGETTYGMIKEREDKFNGWYFFDTEIPGCNISKFSISNQIDIENKEEYESRDFSYNQDGSVILYWKIDYEQNDIKYYEFILASDGEMYTPVDSTYLFAYVGYQKENFKFDLSNLNTSKTTNMSHMLEGAASHAKPGDINIGGKFDTSNVTDMSYMFKDVQMPKDDDGNWGNAKFKFPDNFNTSNVTNMSHMFEGFNAKLLDLGNSFDTKNVTDMSYMFSSDDNLSNLNLGDKFDTSKVTNMEGMFSHVGYLSYMNSLDLGDKFDTSNVKDMRSMFNYFGNSNTESLNLGKKFVISNDVDTAYMFDNCGIEGVLVSVTVPSQTLKEKILSLDSVSSWWSTNNIVQVQE